MAFTFDYSLMCEPAVPGGVRNDDWTALAERFAAAHASVVATAATGVYGYRELEKQAAERTRVTAYAARVQGRYDDIVVLGIGGSSLGAIALRTALLPYNWNARSAEQRGGRPRLHVLDNPDPRTMAGLLDLVTLPRTLFIVISKSGGTIETLAQYLVIRGRVEAAGLAAKDHFAFVTDPVKGVLREISARDGVPVFEVPPNVGGRFSVLSPVGTLPSALCGVDIEAFCAGAMVMRDASMGADLATNPAGLFATLQWRAHQQAGQGIHVLMPYSDALRDLAPWFVQLWAESLGKVNTDGLHVGPTPVAAVGPTDQHSQVQLFMEGPADKTVTFLRLESAAADVTIPPAPGAGQALEFLGGHSLGELVDVECRATAAALARMGRPSLMVSVGAADAWHLGGLMMWLMQATTLGGALYEVNPLDQPGVELGKQLANRELGHSAFAGQPAAESTGGDPSRRLRIG